MQVASSRTRVLWLHKINPSLIRYDHTHHPLVVSKQKGSKGYKGRDRIEIIRITDPDLEAIGTGRWPNQFGLPDRYHDGR